MLPLDVSWGLAELFNISVVFADIAMLLEFIYNLFSELPPILLIKDVNQFTSSEVTIKHLRVKLFMI